MEKPEFVIRNLADLEIALMEDDNSAIKAYMQELDRRTSNEAFRAAGEALGFPTVEINGVVYTSLGHLAHVFGYKSPRALADLLTRRGIYGIKVGGFEHDAQSQLKQALSLSPNDNSAILYEYPAVLVGGMNSTTAEAETVKLYLMKCEKIARVGVMGTRRASVATNADNPLDRMTMQKLAKQANGGDTWAIYALKTYFGWPVEQIAGVTAPETSELAGTIAHFLRFVCEDKPAPSGLTVEETPTGYFLYGQTKDLYAAFADVAAKHGMRKFFSSAQNLGWIMGREAEALSLLGWERVKGKIIRGDRHYGYEYTRPGDPFTIVK